jgi:cytosine/adenosine deaminase-related metal-dependent hydrolase
VTPRGVVLEHARVARHDGVEARAQAFRDGHVVAESSDALRIDLRDHVIFPGLINAHDHLQLNAIPSLEHPEPFANSYEWIDAFEEHRRKPEVAAAVAIPKETRYRHGGLKNLLSGVTTVAHHDPWSAVFDNEFPVNVVRQYGWAHSLGLGASRSGDTRYGPDVQESFAATAADTAWIIHLGEGTDDVARRELACLEAKGCLASNTVIVHGTALTNDDMQRVIACGASVVWCPSSNIAMFGRTLDPTRLANAKRLALGTDSRLTGARDLLDELRVAQANSDLSARELLRAITADAASALRLSTAPELEPGTAGDCLIIEASGDPYDALLATRRSDVRVVVRGGVPQIADPDFADWFAACDVPTRLVTLDGRRKLMAASLARLDVIALEPGLELERDHA